MTKSQANNLLDVSYEQLGYNEGTLLDVEDQQIMDDTATFLDKGPWVEICRHINDTNTFKVEKIFFVDNNPVIVFVNAPEAARDHLHEIFNNIWSMARPRILFIATPGELSVYDLSKSPAREKIHLKSLHLVKSATDVATKLKYYRREMVESGDIFNKEPFAPVLKRADHMLIEDLKTLRGQLSQVGLGKDKISYVHALIGRSIFIRYLEDRKILNKEYFESVAGNNEKWRRILSTPPNLPGLHPGMTDRLYIRVLSDIDFTFALFAQLSFDFNGNMFPSDQVEREIITIDHLLLIRNFLTSTDPEQKSLFFWAYRFDIIPIELISNIYEEFYHYKNSEDKKGTHYTPIPLVEFILSRTLTTEVLEKRPRVIDPACGSGIFLVEAFRRIVRFESKRLDKHKFSFQELEEILKTQIAGIELNEEAIKITAFSIYIAFLHCQEPKSIWTQIQHGNKLPNLIYTEHRSLGKKYLDNLLQHDAFAIESSNLPEKIKSKFIANCADIVIGNPPWGSISSEAEENKEALGNLKAWCKKYLPELTDNETTQAFLWRAFYLLKPEGVCGLLISANIFLKNSENHRKFKDKFLSTLTIREFVNFTPCRHLFFSRAISPFGSIIFKKELPRPDSIILYQAFRKTSSANENREVILDKNDFKFFTYQDTDMPDIWKIFLYGNHRDHALISRIRVFPELKSMVDNSISGDGLKVGNKSKDAFKLEKYKILPMEKFSKYDPLPFDQLEMPPAKVERFGNIKCYDGLRLLVGKGLKKKGVVPQGQFFTRLEETKFAFNSSIYGIKLLSPELDNYKLVFAVLRSTLARYYFLMTASRWGVWRDESLPYEILSIPIAFPENLGMKTRLLGAVNPILEYMSNPEKNLKKERTLEKNLDDVVFDLYSLSDADKDLIWERCLFDFDNYFHGMESVACQPVSAPTIHDGFREELPKIDYLKELFKASGGIAGGLSLVPYLDTFIKQLAHFTEKDNEIHWQVVAPPGIRMMAVIFTLTKKSVSSNSDKDTFNIKLEDVKDWRGILSQLAGDSRHAMGKRIYIDGMVKIITSRQIIIVKRNQARLWTKSSARDDADAMILRAIKKKYPTRT